MDFSNHKRLKIDAVGNFFLFVFDPKSGFDEAFKPSIPPEVVQKVCSQNKVDGLVFLKQKDIKKFVWQFYNSDGSEPNFCANAARSVGFIAATEFKDLSDFTRLELQIKSGIVPIFKDKKDNFSVEMPRISVIAKDAIMIGHGNLPIDYSVINTGVPHLVTFVDSIELDPSKNQEKRKDLALLAKSLRFPGECNVNGTNDGANITFVEQRSSYIKAITFERGVEDFTLSCGTGAVAARWLVKDSFTFKQHLKVVMPGGELLVELLENKEKNEWRASLGGDVKISSS